MKIISCLTIYNPNIETLIKNIHSFIDDINLLCIVDNSEIKTDLCFLTQNTNIKVFKTDKNRGIGYALNLVANKAINEGFDWMLMMDQDSYFENNSFKKMKEIILKENNSKLAILYPHVIYEEDYNFNNSTNNIIKTTKTELPITSGSLLNLKIYPIVGSFDEELFLDRIDFDYALRIKFAGFEIKKINSVILNHKLGQSKLVSFLGKIIRITNHPPLRRYYMTRNSLYMIKKYIFKSPYYSLYEFRTILTDILKILFYEGDKINKFIMMLKGFIDFIKGKKGIYTN
ncbi:MAG: glycosyltransferase [Elusimicrobiales bacterium]|nr:glycosyltransferase [Elusimicrobiales bacterium]